MLTVHEDIARLSGEYVVITVILDRFEKILHFPVDAVFYHLIAIQSDWIDETARRYYVIQIDLTNLARFAFSRSVEACLNEIF